MDISGPDVRASTFRFIPDCHGRLGLKGATINTLQLSKQHICTSQFWGAVRCTTTIALAVADGV